MAIPIILMILLFTFGWLENYIHNKTIDDCFVSNEINQDEINKNLD